MFDGNGIDTEVGLAMAALGFGWIAAVMIRGALGSLAEWMRKREK